MRKSKVLSSVLAGCMTLSAFTGLVSAESAAAMSVDVNNVIKSTTGGMYGLSTDFAVSSEIVKDWEGMDGTPNTEFVGAMNQYGLPLVRLGEGAMNKFEWKQAIGDMSDRTAQALWGTTGPVAAGPLEQVNTFEAIDKNVAFSITLNMKTDTAEDAADYAEFLTGGVDTEWGAIRASMGHPDPVNVVLYELGNEVDYITDAFTISDYITLSKQFITAIEAVDTDAKFAAIAKTEAYNGVQNNNPSDWRDWHSAILSDAELAADIDYIAVHTYLSHYKNEIMDTVIGNVEDDIETITGSDRIKVYLSEYALAIYDYNGTTTNPHSMQGVVETANMLSRMMWHDGVELSAYHGIDSSEWKNIVYDTTTGDMYLNAIGNLLKTFKEYGVGDVLSSSFTGFAKNQRSTSSGVAVKDKDGNINLIFSNATDEAIDTSLSFSNNAEYKKIKETVMSAASLEADNEVDTNEIDVSKYYYTDDTPIVSYTIPAYSVCAVTLEKTADVEKDVLYSNDFSSSSSFEVSGDGTAEVSNGNLVLYSGEYMTMMNNYVYLPYNNTSTSFRFEADVTVDSMPDEAAINGIILNSSSASGEIANANMIRYTENGVEEVVYTDGIDGVAIASGTAPAMAPGYKAHYTVDVNDGTVVLSINGVEVYSRTGGFANSTGYMGFMFCDTNCSVDNVSISTYEATPVETVDLKKLVSYSENFDTIEDGNLPANWEVMCDGVTAAVEDGELVLESHDQHNSGWVKIGNVGNLKRDGLVLEADMTMVSYDEAARAQGERNMGGFAYMADGKNLSVGGLLSFFRQGEFYESGTTSKPNAGTDTGFMNGDKTNFKLVFNGTKSPDLYLNGVKKTYYNIDNTTQNSGAIGLMAIAGKVKFDNIKISGIQINEAKAEDVTEKLVDFNYEEDFDDANGTSPLGWSVYDHTGATSGKVTAVVQDGSLVLKSDEWWSGGYLLFDMAKLQRKGLTMEMDITRNAAAPDNQNNSRVGFAFMGTKSADEKTAVASHVDLYTDAPVNNHKTRVFGSNNASLTSFDVTPVDGKPNVTNGGTVNFKIVCTSDTKTPDIYINGVKINEWTVDTNNTVLTGLVGLYAYDTNVKIDNLKITGKTLETVVDNSTYAAEFTTADREFASEAAAKAAVKVTETTPEGIVTDITNSSSITSSVDGKNCTITVMYAGKLVDTLTCTIMDKVLWNFTYEENFDALANGTLPAGWTVYGNATAAVSNGALVLKGTDWWTDGYALFDMEDVARQGLTMEMDITRSAATSNGNSNNSRAGFAYMASVADGAVTASRNEVYTDKTITNQQGIAADLGQTATFTDSTVTPLQNGGTIKLKIVCNNETQTPVVYLNGVETTYVRGWSAEAVKQGLIGLCACNSQVTIDNIKISGKKMTPVSEAKTVTAEFTTASTKFESAQEAESAVKVTETDYLGVTSDVTANADITSSVDGKNCTVTVMYEGRLVKTLSCTIAEIVSEGFMYEENFDTLANGTLPTGWTVYGNAAVSVSDGALTLNGTDWWTEGYVLFDIANIARQGITMEMDITRSVATSNGNSNNSRAGFAYMAKVTDGVVTASRSELYTDKAVTKQQGIMSEQTLGFSTEAVSPLQDNATVKFKIVFNNQTQTPVVYMNGAEVSYSRGYDANFVKEGLIGLCACNSKVTIDNLKVYATNKTDKTEVSSVAVNGTKFVDSTLSVSVNAKNANADITNAVITAAVYEKVTGKLVAMSELKDWNAATYKSMTAGLTISGVTEYSSEDYEVKIIAMDKQSLKPVAQNAEF